MQIIRLMKMNKLDGGMDTNNEVPRICETPLSNATKGIVSWSPLKSIWYLSHMFIAFVAGMIYFSVTGLMVFLVFTVITLCLGHSLGMHRRLIHNSYDCPLWMEYLFVHLGVLVGMAGPYGMVYQHDLRDWVQRQSDCHPYLRHGYGFWKDGWMQLNCELNLDKPPLFELEERIKHDRVYALMEKTWMLQQLPWALLLFYFGGISWVVWGISARIFISLTGHWLIGHFAHNHGTRDWHVEGAAVQGHNIRFAGLITMGESWHNNHHAYPGSAMLGLYRGQSDPGWWLLNRLMNIGLVWNVKLPKDLAKRDELQAVSVRSQNNDRMKLPSVCHVLAPLVGRF